MKRSYDEADLNDLEEELARKKRVLQDLNDAYVRSIRRREEIRRLKRRVPDNNPAATRDPCPEPTKYRETCEDIYGQAYKDWLATSKPKYTRLKRELQRETRTAQRAELGKQLRDLNKERVMLLREVHPDKVQQSSNPAVQKVRECKDFLNRCAQYIISSDN